MMQFLHSRQFQRKQSYVDPKAIVPKLEFHSNHKTTSEIWNQRQNGNNKGTSNKIKHYICSKQMHLLVHGVPTKKRLCHCMMFSERCDSLYLSVTGPNLHSGALLWGNWRNVPKISSTEAGTGQKKRSVPRQTCFLLFSNRKVTFQLSCNTMSD